jgi:hypothetical protein
MHAKYRLLLWLILLGTCLRGQPTPVARQDKSEDFYWMVVKNDAIKSRLLEGGPERPFKGAYNPLRPSDEVFCTMTVVPSTRQQRGRPNSLPTCTLEHIILNSQKPVRLTDKLPANRWVRASSIPDIPEPTQLVRTSRELLEEMRTKTRPGGLVKASGCTGNLPIVAPACLETIDLSDFTVEWTDVPGGGMYASLFLETLDEVRPQSVRLDRILLDKHQFSDPRIRQFLEDIQQDSVPTNLLLRLSQSQGVEATRVLTIPSRIEQKGYHDELGAVGAQHALFRNISLLAVYVNFRLWSKAARQARELLALAPDEELVKSYALVGFCQSGYSRETEELRTSLRRLGITDICPIGPEK